MGRGGIGPAVFEGTGLVAGLFSSTGVGGRVDVGAGARGGGGGGVIGLAVFKGTGLFGLCPVLCYVGFQEKK